MTEQQPLVSIVIPCYNHAQFVQETIQSVIDQDYENIELIIIDDGSKDNSVEVIQEMIPACEERFVRFEFRYRPNKGLCATLNEALQWCEGKYFAPVASDDIIKSHKTRIQVDYLEKNQESHGVFGQAEVLSRNGISARARGGKKEKKFNFNDILLHKHVFYASTQMLRLDSVKNTGGYKENLMIEDWSMWLFLTQNGGTLDFTNNVFSTYRMHENNTINQHDKMHQGCLEVLLLFKDNKNYKKALAKLQIVYAQNIQTKSKIESIPVALEAIKTYPFIMLEPIFYWYLAKNIISFRREL